MLNITTGLSMFIHLKVIWEMWNANLDDFLWDGSIKELNFLEWGKGWDFFLDGKGGGDV